MDILSRLQEADENLFHFINTDLSAPWLDVFMMLMRNQYTWLPVYAILLFWFFKYSKEYFLLVLVFSIITFALTDYSSASILKPILARTRPCHNTLLYDRLVANCGGMYGMPSSHACNHFGLATFWFLYAANIYRQNWYWLWAWALIICYAQVYVGVHYPGDILAGAILGGLYGLLTFKVFYFFAMASAKRKKKFLLQH